MLSLLGLYSKTISRRSRQLPDFGEVCLEMNVSGDSTMKKVWFSVTIVAAVILGGIVGTLFGSIAGQQYNINLRKQRSDYALSKMQSFSIGDTIPDSRLETLAEQPFRLYDSVRGPAIVTFFGTECEGCRDEFRRLSEILSACPEYVSHHFIWISANSPRYLKEFTEIGNGTVNIFYDHRSKLLNRMNIMSYPFSVILDSSLIIQDAVSGPLLDDDIDNLIETVKAQS